MVGVQGPVRLLWICAGTVFLGIGIAGVILPLLPGTVFLFAASACYLRGSDRLHGWLIHHPVLGRHVRIMAGAEKMPRRAKVMAIGAMWIAVGVSVYAAKLVAVQVGMVVLAVIGTWYISTRR